MDTTIMHMRKISWEFITNMDIFLSISYARLHDEDPCLPLGKLFYVGFHDKNPFHPLR